MSDKYNGSLYEFLCASPVQIELPTIPCTQKQIKERKKEKKQKRNKLMMVDSACCLQWL
jgi:hypothetical protein